MYAENELLFPPYAVSPLKNAAGAAWRDLVDRVEALPEDHPESLAFSLMMIRLNGCLGCETDSYRAMRGCIACAQQTLRRYKGTDEDLLNRYHKALEDISSYLRLHPIETPLEEPVPARAA